MRTGCLELRIETGRWERVSVKGRQVPVRRELRFCRLCGAETEDAEHLLLRCPAYECELRTLVQSGQRAGINQSAISAEWWKWIFGGKVARQLHAVDVHAKTETVTGRNGSTVRESSRQQSGNRFKASMDVKSVPN